MSVIRPILPTRVSQSNSGPSSRSSKTDSSEKNEISTQVPLEQETVLCILRIFREAVKNPPLHPFPATVKIFDPEEEYVLCAPRHAMIQGESADFVFFLPKIQKVGIAIMQKVSARSPRIKDLEVMSGAGIYEVRSSQTITMVPLQSIALAQKREKEPNFLIHKKISISESRQMTLNERSENSLRLENLSVCYQVINIELNHSLTGPSVSLSYSVGPKQVIDLPLGEIIEAYQEAYQFKYDQSLRSHPNPEDLRIISITYISYLENS